MGAVQPAAAPPILPRRLRRVREHRRLGHRTLLITGALDVVVAPLRPLFDDIICASLGATATTSQDAWPSCPQSARRAPSCSPTTPMRTVSRSRSRSPTPTRPVTSPCSRPSASPSPSIPSRVWRASHGGAGGTWSTGTRPPAARSACCPSARSRAPVQGARGSTGMKSLEIERSLPRFAAARLAAVLGSGRGAGIGPLRLVEGATPELPGADWSLVHPRLSGICGSDLSTIDGRTSRYFEALVSFPFVPGHEVVATMDEPAAPRRDRWRRRRAAWCSSRSSAAWRVASSPVAPPARQAAPATASTWRSDT